MGYKKVDSELFGHSSETIARHQKKETQAFCNTTGTRTLGHEHLIALVEHEHASQLPAIITLTQNGEHATHYEALTIRLDKGKRRSSKLKRKT